MRIIGLLQKHGPLGLVIKYIEKKSEPMDKRYAASFAEFLPDESELDRQREAAMHLVYQPKISIVVPAYRTPERFLRAMVESVLAQTYGNWELCIADATDDSDMVGDIVRAYQKQDDRIVYRRLSHNGGISENTNEGFRMVSGEYVALLDHDDLLAANALYEVARCLNEAPYKMLYSDEDKVDEEGIRHFEAHFKPDYNEELLNHYNYICHFLVVHRSLIESAGFLDARYDGAQDYDFVLRCTELLDGGQIAHIPKILYHWRVHAASTANYSGSKDYAYEAGRQAVQAHLDRIGETAKVVPVKGRESLGIHRKQSDSADRCTAFVGENCRPVTPDWEKALAAYFSCADIHAPVGMVGGKLVNGEAGPFRRIIACGYTFQRDGRVLPLFEGLHAWKKGYYRRAAVSQEIGAVSLEFCVVDKAAMEAVGGIDASLPSPYRDMDFALRLQNAGYRVILAPEVCAVCRQHKEDSGDLEQARRVFQTCWETVIRKGDRYYNENFSGNGYI